MREALRRLLKREARYAARAAEVKQQARGRWLTAAEFLDHVRPYDISREQAQRLLLEVLQTADAPAPRAVVVAPRLAVCAFLVWEDVPLGELAMWRGAKFRFVDGPAHHIQPSWRRAKKGKRK